VAIEAAERLVEEYWLRVRPSPEKLAQTREQIEHHVDILRATSEKELTRQRSRLERLDREERKLLEAHYADAVSLTLLRDEQSRIAAERQQARQILAATQMQFDEISAEIEDILDTLGNGYELYRSAGPAERRTMNRSGVRTTLGSYSARPRPSEPVKSMWT
jgi:chromosome segregation ATPase